MLTALDLQTGLDLLHELMAQAAEGGNSHGVRTAKLEGSWCELWE